VDRTNGRAWNGAGTKVQGGLPSSPFELLDRADKSFLAAAGSPFVSALPEADGQVRCDSDEAAPWILTLW
jgi:hypothetical protein